MGRRLICAIGRGASAACVYFFSAASLNLSIYIQSIKNGRANQPAHIVDFGRPAGCRSVGLQSDDGGGVVVCGCVSGAVCYSTAKDRESAQSSRKFFAGAPRQNKIVKIVIFVIFILGIFLAIYYAVRFRDVPVRFS